MDASEVEAQVEGFIARFEDGVAGQIRAARLVMQARLPGALELVYDNYNALAIGYGPTERQADIIFSIAAYPRWISLFFASGAGLDDPGGLLKGEGSMVRHVVLADAETLSEPHIAVLMEQALRLAPTRLDPDQPQRTIIKSVSAKQRARHPLKI